MSRYGIPVDRNAFLEEVPLRDVFQRTDERERVAFMGDAAPERGELLFHLTKLLDRTPTLNTPSVAVLELLVLCDGRAVK